MESTLIGIVVKILAIVTGLVASVSTLQADVNAIKASQPSGNFGAVSSLTSPLVVDGVTTYYYKQTFKSGTSTVCSFKLPNATTTGDVFFRQNSGLSFAQEYEVAVGADNNSTTTKSLGKIGMISGGGNDGVATTTAVIFAPGRYINVKMATSTGTTVNTGLAPVGTCEGVFRVI